MIGKPVVIFVSLAAMALSSPAFAGDKIPRHCDRKHARPANPYGSVLIPSAGKPNQALPVEPDNEISAPPPRRPKSRKTGAHSVPMNHSGSC